MPRLPCKRNFAAPWGREVRVVTILTLATLLGLAGYFALLHPFRLFVVDWVVLGAVFLTVGGMGLLAVRGYSIVDRSVLIRRLFWDTAVSLGTVQSAVADPAAMKRSLRIAGNGGLFALTGWFRNRQLGFYRAFVTDRRRCVVIRGTERTVVLSPDDPQAFVEAMTAVFDLRH